MRDLTRLYDEFFGLRERPFSLLPDPDFLFWSGPHQKAYTMLEYGMATHAPITMITGEIGSGKTTLVRKLLNDMPADLSVGLISNAQGDRGELLHWVLMSLGQPVEPGLGYVALFRQFQDYLIDVYAEGRRTALIFDEAQNLSPLALEELRMFSNINADKDQLLQLILVGQPELRELVRQPVLQQFAQRIASDFHLRAFRAEETDAYILHRLAHAGATREVFEPHPRAMIHVAARGIPRLINQLCDYALVYAYSEERSVVDTALVRDVLEDRRHSGMFRVDEALSMPAAQDGADALRHDPASFVDHTSSRAAISGEPHDGQPHVADPVESAPDAAAPGRREAGAQRQAGTRDADDQDGEEQNVFYGVWDRQV